MKLMIAFVCMFSALQSLSAQYRVEFHSNEKRPRDEPRTKLNESLYESTVKVYKVEPRGNSQLLGTFRGSIYPDNLKVRGRIKEGSYELHLGLHRRSKDGKALKPTKAALKVKMIGFLRPALIVERDKSIPCVSDNPKKKTMTYIHVHNGSWTRRSSEGCLTIAPPDWERFISIFLKAYPDLHDWHNFKTGTYYSRKIGPLIVKLK